MYSDILQIQLQSYTTIVHSEYMLDRPLCTPYDMYGYVIHDMTSFMQHLTSSI